MKQVAIFCGSYPGSNPTYMTAAHQMGMGLAQRGLGLVYGGGRVGLMGAVADGTLAGGGKVMGVIPQSLVDRGLADTGLSEMYVVTSMHERKAIVAEVADA